MSRDFVGALLQLNAEKQVSKAALIRAVEEGMKPHRRVAGAEDIFVRVEAATGDPAVYRGRHVVDEIVERPSRGYRSTTRKTNPDAVAGEVVEIEQLDAEHFGRIGAQTAKHAPAHARGRARPDVRPVRLPRGRS